MMIIPHTAHTNQTEGAKIARSGKYTGGAPVDCFQTAFSFVSGWFQAHFWLVSGPFLVGFRPISGWFQVRFWLVSGPYPVRNATISLEAAREAAHTHIPTRVKLITPVFSRILPCFTASRLSPTCLAPVSSGYACHRKRAHENAGNVAGKNTGTFPRAIGSQSRYACPKGEMPTW
jgi:hypothetical protein